MNYIEYKNFDEERALYGQQELTVRHCRFDGPADGESAFKEGKDITVEECYFNLRYPFWHTDRLSVSSCELTPLCRAALWYSTDITLSDCTLHGIKALRECARVSLTRCDIDSTEFGWFVQDVNMRECQMKGEYVFLRSSNLTFKNMRLDGKYSFQYIENALFEECELYTKDAFWHAKNVVVKNCTVKGEYLAWYCENVTFENCKIIGTQPLCYCKGLKLINCEMIDADLAFEKSEVSATVTTPMISIKNPAKGEIVLPSVQELIMDDPCAKGQVIFTS